MEGALARTSGFEQDFSELEKKILEEMDEKFRDEIYESSKHLRKILEEWNVDSSHPVLEQLKFSMSNDKYAYGPPGYKDSLHKIMGALYIQRWMKELDEKIETAKNTTIESTPLPDIGVSPGQNQNTAKKSRIKKPKFKMRRSIAMRFALATLLLLAVPTVFSQLYVMNGDVETAVTINNITWFVTTGLCMAVIIITEAIRRKW